MSIAAELLELLQEYRQDAIKEWESLPTQGIPQPVGYTFSFSGFCDWLEERQAAE